AVAVEQLGQRLLVARPGAAEQVVHVAWIARHTRAHDRITERGGDLSTAPAICSRTSWRRLRYSTDSASVRKRGQTPSNHGVRPLFRTGLSTVSWLTRRDRCATSGSVRRGYSHVLALY